jgi:lysyl endopeptidase
LKPTLLLNDLMKKSFCRISFILLYVAGFNLSLCGQLSHGGKPVRIDTKIMQNVPVIDISDRSTDKSFSGTADEDPVSLKHLYFARNYSIVADPQTAGKWIIDSNRNKIWLLGIRSHDSYSIGLILSRFHLLGEARIFVYNEGRRYIAGAFTKENNSVSGILPVTHIPGNCIYIQLEIPSNQADYGELMIGEAAASFLPIFTDEPLKDGRYGLSGSCNIDINCEEGADWQDLKRSVCRIVTNGNKYCTGTLLNTANSSREPYVLTAAHCIGSQGEANKSIFYFNYESPTCDGPDGSISHQISGATLISTGDTLGESLNRDSLDFTLVKLNVSLLESFMVYYAGWNRSLMPADETVTIHHPLGDVKKISVDFDPPQTSYHYIPYYPEYVMYSHWRILEWNLGTTENGSSGSPLFDQNMRLIGLLTGGLADCEAPVNDYFTKFNYCWNYYSQPTKNLQTWLDPLNTGTYMTDGLDWNAHVDPSETTMLNVYPNPGTGDYYIRLDNNSVHNGMFYIYTITGEIIQTGMVENDNIFRFKIHGFPSGFYFIRLVFSDRILTARIIHLPD